MSKFSRTWEIPLETNEGGKWMNYLIEPDWIGMYYDQLVSEDEYKLIKAIARHTPKWETIGESVKMRWATERDLATQTCFSRPKVHRLIRKLENRGLLKVRRGDRNKANEFSIAPFSKAVREIAKANGYEFKDTPTENSIW